MLDCDNIGHLTRNVNSKRSSGRERAAVTRGRIVRAAHDLFVEQGYSGTRMTDIAAKAGVAVQTVYFTFHTKAELLSACYERAVLGEDAAPPPLQPWYAETLAATSGEKALRAFAVGNGSILARIAVLDDVVRAAVHEPEAIAVRNRSEELRRAGYLQLIDHCERQFGLREGLDRDSATDLLLTFGGAALYRTLVVEYGWSHSAFIEWVSDTLAEVLLAESA